METRAFTARKSARFLYVGFFLKKKRYYYYYYLKYSYLLLSETVPLGSAIISKATKAAAFYGDPCLSGQFRGALVIALPACAQKRSGDRDRDRRERGREREEERDSERKTHFCVIEYGTDERLSGQLVPDPRSHTVYFISRGRV